AAMFGLWDCKALQSVGWKIAATSIAVCISLSTVFMKQHSIMDVLAALPVCFFGWWIAYKILPNNKTNRFLTRM
ncbi:putative transcriptional regulator, partial [Dysosmobacter welbionis]